MTKRSVQDFFEDILSAITEIESFIDGITFDEFQRKREKILAVVKLLEIIGEATKQIPDSFRLQYPQITWQSVAGMRDILIHEYWDIDVNVVWATVTEYLPDLKSVIQDILLNLTNDF
jgi:uncharacterized protein with HEPN domain